MSIRPLVYEEKQHRPAQPGAQLDVDLIPISPVEGNGLSVSETGLVVSASGMVASDDALLEVQEDGRIHSKPLPETVVVSADKWNLAVKGTDGGAMVKASNLLSNGGGNLLHEDEVDHRLTLTLGDVIDFQAIRVVLDYADLPLYFLWPDDEHEPVIHTYLPPGKVWAKLLYAECDESGELPTLGITITKEYNGANSSPITMVPDGAGGLAKSDPVDISTLAGHAVNIKCTGVEGSADSTKQVTMLLRLGMRKDLEIFDSPSLTMQQLLNCGGE